MPEDMPDRMPEDMPEDMSDRMPEDMPDRMPEDMSVRKCINVMVGITRSKVIDLFHKHILTNYMCRVDFALKDMFAKVLPFDFVGTANKRSRHPHCTEQNSGQDPLTELQLATIEAL